MCFFSYRTAGGQDGVGHRFFRKWRNNYVVRGLGFLEAFTDTFFKFSCEGQVPTWILLRFNPDLVSEARTAVLLYSLCKACIALFLTKMTAYAGFKVIIGITDITDASLNIKNNITTFTVGESKVFLNRRSNSSVKFSLSPPGRQLILALLKPFYYTVQESWDIGTVDGDGQVAEERIPRNNRSMWLFWLLCFQGNGDRQLVD